MALGTVAHPRGTTGLPFQSKPADCTNALPIPWVEVMKSKASFGDSPGMANDRVSVVEVTEEMLAQPRVVIPVPANTRTTSAVVMPFAVKLQVEQTIVVPPVPFVAISMLAPFITLP